MRSLTFDERKLLLSLDTLPVILRAAFAAACAERIFRGYLVRFKPVASIYCEVVGTALDALWDDLTGKSLPERELRHRCDQCMSLVKDEDDLVDDSIYADDAIASVVYSIQSRLRGGSQDAVWAARRAGDALDHYIANDATLRKDGGASEEQIRCHPLMQAELTRQHRDLAQLLAAGNRAPGGSSLIADLRCRANREAETYFGLAGGSHPR
jgi:hypothetical protein